LKTEQVRNYFDVYKTAKKGVAINQKQVISTVLKKNEDRRVSKNGSAI